MKSISAPFEIVDTFDEMGMAAKGLVRTDNVDRSVGPIVVDFLSGKMRHRVRSSVDQELLVKAIGLKKSERQKSMRQRVLICDFTAGLGTDAFLLASAGYHVVAFERDSRIFALLTDGLRRYREYESRLGLTPLQLDLRSFDTALASQVERDRFLVSLETEFQQRPFAVLIDPMFEDKNTKRKSKPKKEMAIFREMLLPSTEAELQRLLETALRVSEGRVIVKRSIGAQPIGASARPLRRSNGKTAAFDIYACRKV